MQPPTRLPAEPSGNAKEVGWFRTVLKNIRERTLKVGPGLRASYKVDGTYLELVGVADSSAAAPASAEIKRMQITAVASTYVVAQSYAADETTLSGESFNVALQKYHRGSTYADLTLGGYRFRGLSLVNISGLDDNDTLAFTVFPPPTAGDDIIAAKPEGKTDLVVSGTRLEWMDTTARWLMPELRVVNVCRLEGGIPVTRRILVAGGAIH